MATVEVTRDTFVPTIEQNDTVVFDFWAPWCGPCRFFAPVFEAASESRTDITFAKVDTEAQRELAAALRVTSIPTLMVFREGILVFRETGALPAPALEELLSRVQDLDMDAIRAEMDRAAASRGASAEG